MQSHAILVLGMHRGGTSALTGALLQLGLGAPRTLMPPDASNELGYWESAPISHFHDRLLRALGTSWDAWTPVSVGEAFPAREAYARELETLVAQEYGPSACFVVKDPRMCRLVPFWAAVLATAGVPPACVIIVRSPAEVARSLAVRDGVPPQLAALLWLRHMLAAEAATRAMPRSIVRYGDLLSDWPAVLGRVAKDLDLRWPTHALDPDQPVGRYLRPQLRHHVAVGSSGTAALPPVSEWLADAVSAFDRLAAGDVFDHGRVLDDIRTRLDHAAASFGMSVDGPRALEQRELVHARERVAQLVVDSDHLRSDVSRLEMERDQQTRQLEAALHERDICGGRLHDVDATRQHVEARARELESQLAATRHHLAAVLSSLSWQVTAPARAGLTAMQRLLGKSSQSRR